MAPPRKQDDPRSLDPLGGGGLRHNPFAALRPGGQPAPQEQAQDGSPAEAPGGDDPNGRLVVALERKGHGGKSVVRIQGLESPDQAKELARALGKALGRGARVSGSDILVQGGDLDAPIDWLRARGRQRIVRGTP